MIPKTEIRFSWTYNKMFNESLTPSEFIESKNEIQEFSNLYNKYIKKILQTIEDNNEPWQREFIPIYIVFGKIRSFSDPLTIKYRKDPKLMILILIHELIHNNIRERYKNPSLAHKKINMIFEKVLTDMNFDGFEDAKEKYKLFS